MAALAGPHRNITHTSIPFPDGGDRNWLTHSEQWPTQNQECIYIQSLIWWHLIAKLEPKRCEEMEKKKKRSAIRASLPLKFCLQGQVTVPLPIPLHRCCEGHQDIGTDLYSVSPSQSRNRAVFGRSSTKPQRMSVPWGQRESLPSESTLEDEDQ